MFSLRVTAQCLITIFCLSGPTVRAQWVKPPTSQHHKQYPGLVHETFDSQAMKTRVGYSVVLPASYKSGKKRYPVVYWLHGGGGNESSSLATSKHFTELAKAKSIGEVILVYPNGFRSGYMDHYDKKIMNESMIIRELIPRIDKQYRTIAERRGRAVHGFSMGASGSLKFAFKYPQMFCAAVAYGGGAVDLERTKMPFVVNILKRNLNADPQLIRQNNTYHYLEKNHATVRKLGLEVLLICGAKDSWRKSAEDFLAAMKKKKVVCQLKLVPEVGHGLNGLSRAEGATAARFQDRMFHAAKTKSETSQGKPVTTSGSYLSVAEGRRQSYQLVLPPGYDKQSKYPLFVQVYGSNSLLPTKERPFIRVRPNARGVWGFRSMSRYDIMQVIQQVKRDHAVDEDRVYITGTSAGATGVMHAAAQRPDVFAAVIPLVAFGNDLPLENFLNLAVWCEHGVNDWTSAIGNVRVQFQKFKRLGYDAVLHEHPTAGHGIRMPPPKTMDAIFATRRNRSPMRVVYQCEHPRDGRAYWVTIEKLSDPHQLARIDARVKDGRLVVKTQNIARFSLDLSTAPIKDDTKIVLDGDEVERGGDRDGRLAFDRDSRWQATTATTTAIAAHTRRAYGAGSAANLFQGEPLVVVYGTKGQPNETQFLQRVATTLARSGGPHYRPAAVRFPVFADDKVDATTLDKANLLLVGTPEQNALLGKLAAQLPYRIDKQNLMVSGRKPLDLQGSVLSFHYYNPLQPQRLIYVVSPYLETKDRGQFLKNPRLFLPGGDSFKMIDQPDLLVRRADLRIRREMQLDANWQFVSRPGVTRFFPARFSDRTNLAKAHMKVMQREAKVDYAIWWGPEDKGMFGGYDFNWLTTFEGKDYTQADYLVRRRETETMTATLTGKELLDFHNRWISKQELITWPTVEKSAIKSEAKYRIVIPMDMVPKLGTRRKILSAVAPGPDVMPDKVAEEIFR